MAKLRGVGGGGGRVKAITRTASAVKNQLHLESLKSDFYELNVIFWNLSDLSDLHCTSKVKPVYNGHPWDRKKVAVV
jgi:hypothetical protein